MRCGGWDGCSSTVAAWSLAFLWLLAQWNCSYGGSANDTEALLRFKAAALSGGAEEGGAALLLRSWGRTWDCCSEETPWEGVRCDKQGRVRKLALRGVKLGGGGAGSPSSSRLAMEALTKLTELRVLVLSETYLQGELPDMSSWRLLWLLNLSSNSFSGSIPSQSLASLTRLWRLDLSRNSLSGEIPPSINSLSRLLTLYLDHNNLSGDLPALDLPRLRFFDASYNQLRGPIPAALRFFPAASFRHNAGLCGPPLASPCNASVGSNPASPIYVPSSPTGTSSAHAAPSRPNNHNHERQASNSGSPSALGFGVIVAIVVGDIVVLLSLAFLFFACFWKRFRFRGAPTAGSTDDDDWRNYCHKAPHSGKLSGHDPFTPTGFQQFDPSTGEKNRLVFVGDVDNYNSNKCRRFELEDLLRASAEILGKGSFGTTYKAVLENGYAVAVKRLRDVQVSVGRKEFEEQMEAIGRQANHHPNVLPLTAYYCAKDEKLLVYEFMPGGSLSSRLHRREDGARRPPPLDWQSRLIIAKGAARGLAHIHEVCGGAPHGNIKSSNILLDEEGNAKVGDLGLATMLANSSNPAVLASRSVGYRAPEQRQQQQQQNDKSSSLKSDIYSFGVVLLELLTGRPPAQSLQDDGLDLPKWVHSVVREEWTAEVFDPHLAQCSHIEEELVSLLQISMACASPSPSQRPTMTQVVKMIEDLGNCSIEPSPRASSTAASNSSDACRSPAGTGPPPPLSE